MATEKGIRKKTHKKAEESIRLESYFGAYINGYLLTRGTIRKFYDRFGRESPKYSRALEYLKIPKYDREGKFFRTKRNIYKILMKRGLLTYNDINL